MFDEKKQKKAYTGVRDEIREQQKKTKDMTPKERLAYFWFYYKVPFIAGIAAVIFLSIMIHDMVTAKDYNFYALMLNSQNLNDTAISESFSEYADLDNKKYECYIDTMTTLSLKDYTQYDMATYQKIIAQAATNDFDALVLDSAVFYKLSISGFMVDLRTVLSEEELAAYEGNIYYIDQAAIDRLMRLLRMIQKPWPSIIKWKMPPMLRSKQMPRNISILRIWRILFLSVFI